MLRPVSQPPPDDGAPSDGAPAAPAAAASAPAVPEPRAALSSALEGRPVACIVGRKLQFRPQLFWQEVLPQQVANSRLQFHADMASGKNFARLPSEKEYAADGSLARAVARAVPDAEADDDELTSRALREAATWRELTPLRHLLSSCYCSPRSLEPALFEAAQQGHTDHIRLLCTAGASPGAQSREHPKTALHIACENGSEDVARALISADASTVRITSEGNGLTPLEAATQNDLGPMARRLAAYAKEEAAKSAAIRDDKGA